MSNELRHWGILGMKWGHRKSSDGVSRSTRVMAKRDAQRYADAKMFYGKTAGTRRKLLKAELEKKFEKIPGYKKEFDAHLSKVDMSKSAQKAVNERNTTDNVHKGKMLLKKVLGITGSLGVGVASMAYYANKEKVDSFVKDQGKRLVKEAVYNYKRYKVAYSR